MIRIQVLRGARAGDVLEFEKHGVLVGRRPEADLRFEPARELDVSGRHAILFLEDGAWFVRDLGSRNGTFLNGQRVAGDTPVRGGDRIEFGAGGPLVEVHPTTPGPAVTPTRMIRTHFARENRRLRAMAAASAVALAIAAGTLAFVTWNSGRERREWSAERDALLQRMDSVLLASDRAVVSLRGEADGLAQALLRSQAEVRETRQALERAPAPRGEDADQLRRQLRVATEAIARQQLAASLDFRAIEDANRAAVARLFVEADDGSVASATAFSVRRDGVLLTVGHIMAGRAGTRRPRRIAIQFADSEQFFPGRLVALSEDHDLAVVRVENVIGDVPAVLGFNERADTIAAGAPVAVMGYPLGGEVEMPPPGRRASARPLLTAGVVTGSSRERVDLQGYGAAGASGSPVFDGAGRVIGVLFGGRNDDGVSTIVAVPAAAATDLLARAR